MVQTTPNTTINNSFDLKPVEKKADDTIRINLIEDELPQEEITIDNDLGFGLRIDTINEEETFDINAIDLKIDESYFINSTEELIEDDYLEVNEDIFTNNIETINHAIVPKVYQLSDEMESNSLEQDKKIERQIQRIKELKNLNITINNPQGLRDLEKEPAYVRRNKKLDDVPHSSEKQISRLSLFEDLVSGKSEIKTNNSFLHDNVD